MSKWVADDAYRFLLDLPRFAVAGGDAYKPGLERIRALLQDAGNPHLSYPSIHVAGTNGKGSVASMTAAILGAAGLKVGLHTSPHFRGLEERMRIGPEPASQAWVAAAAEHASGSIERVGASFFESTVLLSFLYFAEQAVDVAVIEVGLGGRYDATNVLRPDVSVITEISLEHTDILGPTIRQIAGEKAGIIKPGVPALTIAQGEALDVMRAAAAKVEAPLENVRSTCDVASVVLRLSGTTLDIRTPDNQYRDLDLSLAGRHQVWNAALALRGAEVFRERQQARLPIGAARMGLADTSRYTGLTGRLEVVSSEPTVITDNAHNPQGLKALLEHVRDFSKGRLHVAIGLMKDKDAESVANLLAGFDVSVTVVELGGDRAMDAGLLNSLLKQRGVRVDSYGNVSHVIEEFRRRAEADDVLLLTGSHLVVSEVLRAV